jgi:DNA polymerase-3 subunit epsilon
MALLLECTEINKLWPKYNRALKRFEPKFGLHSYEARNGYKYLAVAKLSKFQTCVESFNSIYEGINMLRYLTVQFDIDTRFCNFGVNECAAFAQEPDVKDLPQIEYHNTQVENALDHITTQKESFAIIDKGRAPNEQSCIWVEKGHFYGMGHITSDIVINTIEDLKDYITPYRSNAYMMQLIKTYKEKYPFKVKQIGN